jgi:uncharacterized repeat protein (TIGR01451 family)
MKRSRTITITIIILALAFILASRPTPAASQGESTTGHTEASLPESARSDYCKTLIYDDITTDTTWTAANSPYCIDTHYWIDVYTDTNRASVTLTIEPGVVVKGEEWHMVLICGASTLSIGQNATLKILGTENNPVIFTTRYENEDWGKIIFQDNARPDDSLIEHAIFEYGAAHYYNPGGDCSIFTEEMIEVNGGSPTIRYSTFRYSQLSGLEVNDGSPTIQENDFIENTQDGLQLEGGTPEVINNQVTQNGRDGFWIGGGTPEIRDNLIAENQDDGFDIGDGSPQIVTNQVLNNVGDGFFIGHGEVVISDTLIMANGDDGLEVQYPNANMDFAELTIIGNADFGMFNNDPNTCLDARNFDWGDPSGPLDSSNANDCALLYNPGGKGDRISNGIIYSGWVGGAQQLSINTWGPPVFSPGQDVTFLIQYNNSMDQTAEDVILTADIPSNFLYQTSTQDGTYWRDTYHNQVFWKLGDLEVGDYGRVALTLGLPWGLPDFSGFLRTNIGARNAQSAIAIDIDEYLNYNPLEATSTIFLTEAEVDALLAAEPDLQELLDYAIEQGYYDMQVTQQVIFDNGKTVTRMFLIDPEGAGITIVSSDGETAFIQAYAGTEFSIYDTTGGLRYDPNGTYEGWGAWAERQSPSIDDCIINCFSNSFGDKVLSEISDTYDKLMNGKTCGECLVKPSWIGCTKCGKAVANAYFPGLSLWNPWRYADAVLDATGCLVDCTADPEKHACEYTKVECYDSFLVRYEVTDIPGSGYRYKICEDGRLSSTWKYLSCNAAIAKGKLCYDDLASDYIYEVDENGIIEDDPCEESRCNETGKGGSLFQAYNLACADAAASAKCNGTPYRVATAHDPNAKSADVVDYALPGQQINYTIEYENTGSGTATSVFIFDRLDVNLDGSTLVINDGGEYNSASRLLSWDIGTLSAGQGGQVTFSVKVANNVPAGTEIVNQADVHFPSALEVTPTNPVVHIINDVIANPQSLETEAGVALNITLIGAALSGGSLSYTLLDEPVNGDLTGTPPNLSYTAAADFNGQDGFSFVVSDGTKQSYPAAVRISVTPATGDSQPPTVVRTSPTEGDTDVRIIPGDPNADFYLPAIKATFSEQVDPSTIDETTFTVNGLTGNVGYLAGSKTAVFYPDTPLQVSTTYQATLTTGVQDNSGNPLQAAHTWSFTTVDPVSIQISTLGTNGTISYGDVPLGASSHQVVSIASVGTDDLTIGMVTLGGTDSAEFSLNQDGCSSQTLAPEDTCSLRVVFAPASEGDKQATLSIPSNDPDSPTTTIPVSGTGVAAATGTIYLPLMLKGQSSQPTGWITILQENFEGSFPGDWYLTDTEPDGFEYLWDKSNCRSYEGDFSAWGIGGGRDGSTLPCFSYYPNNANSWMIYGPFSLADASGGDLVFRTWMNTERDGDKYDYLFRGFSLDGSQFYGSRTAGNSQGDWIERTMDLTDVPTLGDITGQSQVWLGLAFVSDYSVNYPEGAHVDQILLRKYVPGTAASWAVPTPHSPTELPATMVEVPAVLEFPHPHLLRHQPTPGQGAVVR